ncbi:MAG: flagellin [Planctomycetes bacterium]|nr:flagellin [Planctomycetota bacterium]
MSRINTNIPSMVAARILNGQNAALNISLLRLSTGLRINSGKDDPAGLIASENLRAEKVALGAALTNISRADNVLAVAEGGLVEINNLLTELEDLVDRSANEAGISVKERSANQLQIDSILGSINRIANSTEFQGRKLLSGEFAYNLSGVASGDIASVSVNSAKVPNNSSRNVVVEVVQSAQTGLLTFTGSSTGAGNITVEVAGVLGTEVLSFGSMTTIANIVTAVNGSKDITGVSAYTAGNTVLFSSTDYGSKEFVSVRALDGSFTVTGGDAGSTKDFGRDAGVRINGTSATTEGLTATMRSGSLSLDIDLTTTFGTTLGTTAFDVLGGGADFMISPRISQAGLESIGIDSVSTGSLGSTGVGFLASLASGQTNSLNTQNFATAQRILREAQDKVSFMRGRIGAFQKNTLQTTANALAITLENTTAAESNIRDTDFAFETSRLTRSQILVQSATIVLRLANAQPQNVLALLG